MSGEWGVGSGLASCLLPPRGARGLGGGPTRERGRPARMHTRRVPLSFPAIWRPATLPAGTAWARPKRRLGVHPGTRASRPHVLPLRSAQFPCDLAPGHPAGGNGMGSAEAEAWRPPGNAGVPPACTPVACHSVSPRFGARPPCRRERHGLGRSRVLASLPVELCREDGRRLASVVRAGRPRSRVASSRQGAACQWA